MRKNKYGFKFEIEDVVRPKSVDWENVAPREMGGKEERAIWGPHRPKRQGLRVIGQVLEICYGGEQRHYKVRSIFEGDSVGVSLFQMSEIELEASGKKS